MSALSEYSTTRTPASETFSPTSVTLSEEQLKIANSIISRRGKRASLAGLAGTGKTTVLKYIYDQLIAMGKEVIVMAPSGKAATVLRAKGVPAITIHSGIYHFRGQFVDQKGETQLVFKDNMRRGFADLLLIDEVSMVGSRMLADIEQKEIPSIFFGDPGQLPPVRDEQTSLLSKPTYQLKQIHRQAAGNPIIQLAHHVRNGGRLDEKFAGINYVDVRGKGPKTVVTEMLDRGVDRMLTRTNAQRIAINTAYRATKGYLDGSVEVGEQIICLQNNYPLGVINGEIFEVLEVTHRNVADTGVVLKNIDTGAVGRTKVWNAQFHGEKRCEEVHQSFMLADFAYAITGHKSQGSSWKHVGFTSRGFVGDEARWNYTAITRAEQTLSIF